MVFSETDKLMVEDIDFSANNNMKTNMENPSAEKTKVGEAVTLLQKRQGLVRAVTL